MLLFMKISGGQVIIPTERIYNICAVGCRVSVNYDSGELLEVGSMYQKKIETVSVVFDSDDLVNKILRQFYKACNNNAGAFFFGEV